MNKKITLYIALSFYFNHVSYAQIIDEFSGNIQLNHQTFNADPSIGAEERPPYSNGFINLFWTKNKFTFGQRLEYYKNPITGFEEYKGQGLSNHYVQYKNKKVNVTLGHYYEEFGNGLIFKTYYDQGLGINNSISGLKFKYSPKGGVYFTALIGKQKSFWGYQINGMVRGLNTDLNINTIFLTNWETTINFGLSFVTKQEDDLDPIYILPENVGAWNARLNISGQKLSLNIDYAYKINDPSAENGYIYKDGSALIITSNYSKRGLGISLGLKRIDNMSFRSERNAVLQDLNINYITPLNKQQSYSLATIYPYISQPNGEMGSQLDVFYKIPKKSKLGGKYGMNISINFSNVFDIQKSEISPNIVINQSGTLGYHSDFFRFGENKLFQEINIEINKKFSKKTRLIGTYINTHNNDKILKSQTITMNQDHEFIKANIIILELFYKIKPKHNTRFELQHLNTKQHFGNWMMGLIEYKLSPYWFWSIQDLYNYGHPNEKNHYYSVSAGYNKNSNRFIISYGKQRAGLFCVGGVCREVPSSNGISFGFTSSF